MTLELPPHLAVWTRELAALPPDLAVALAPWLGPLSLAVGTLGAAHDPHAGDPDGYGGLARRGSYERLVAAEWALADAAPDEFLRRAASSEHLFLEIARRTPRADQRSIALLSAGPLQLGAPRLAHIAILVVLARRAAAAGTSFQWGVLEDRGCVLHDGIDERGLRALLDARTLAVTAAPGWPAALGDARDLWLVGGGELAGASRIAVADVIAPGVRALDVAIERRGRRTALRLDLPPSEICGRLMREPIPAKGAAWVGAAEARVTDVRFSPNGRRLLLQCGPERVESWPIPSSPRDRLGKPRAWAMAKRRVVAIGVGAAAPIVAVAHTHRRDQLNLYYGTTGPVVLGIHSGLARVIELGAPVGQLALVHEDRSSDLMIHVGGELGVARDFALWPAPHAQFHAELTAARGTVVAASFSTNGGVWVEHGDDLDVRVVELAGRSTKQRATVRRIDGFTVEAQVGFGGDPHSWGAIAIRRANRASFALHRDPALPDTQISWNDPVLGVGVRGTQVMTLLRDTDRTLAWNIGAEREVLPPASGRIVDVTVCPVLPLVAWRTEAGAVEVYHDGYRAILCRIEAGA
ncbi:MAG TPA: hypothetical protein VGM88_10820 [Kofleriaceae bacterium]